MYCSPVALILAITTSSVAMAGVAVGAAAGTRPRGVVPRVGACLYDDGNVGYTRMNCEVRT